MPNIILECMKKMCSEDLLKKPEFLEIKHETLATILKADKSNVSEFDIFQFADRWADRYCTNNGQPTNIGFKRKALGEAAFDIRFGYMSTEEFTKCSLT